MKTTIYSNKNNVLVILIVMFVSFLGLQGCGSNSSTASTPDLQGFYDAGTAAVKESDNTIDLNITDLYGMFTSSRFILMSNTEVLVYDGTITDITDNTYTATVNVYKDGVLLANTATVSGTFVEDSSIEGTLTGLGEGNGSFSLVYSLNNEVAALSRVSVASNVEWTGPINGATNDSAFTLISNQGDLTRVSNTPYNVTPVLNGCEIDTTSILLPISNLNIYNVSLTLKLCVDLTVNGDYTGFATTQSSIDDYLIITFTNSGYSGSGILRDWNSF